MPLAVGVVPAVVAVFTGAFGEVAVAPGLAEVGAGEVTAVAFAGEAAAGGEDTAEGAAGAGLVAGPAGVGFAVGGAFSSSTGARFPMFDKSGPNLILPSTTGRSKR